jgi:hypothetical protein
VLTDAAAELSGDPAPTAQPPTALSSYSPRMAEAAAALLASSVGSQDQPSGDTSSSGEKEQPPPSPGATESVAGWLLGMASSSEQENA